MQTFSPCFVERSRATEEAAQYNYILDEIKENSSLPRAKTTHSGVMEVNGNKIPPTLPPRPGYQTVDPSTIEPVNHERRNSGTYEELNFGTWNESQDYENPDETKADLDEYLEPLNDTSLPNGNPVPSVSDGPDEKKSDFDQYIEPIEDPLSNVCDNPDEGKRDLGEYLELLNDTSLPNGTPAPSVNHDHGPEEERPDFNQYLEPTEDRLSNVCDNSDEGKHDLDEYLEPVSDTSLPNENPASRVPNNPEEEKPLDEYLELLNDTSLTT